MVGKPRDVTVWVPELWSGGRERIPETERLKMALLRVCGCSCTLPLLGCAMNDDGTVAGPRCRLCNVKVRMHAPSVGTAVNSVDDHKRDSHLAES